MFIASHHTASGLRPNQAGEGENADAAFDRLVIALADSALLPPVFGILSTIAIFFGGVLLGAVTGKAVQWMSNGRQTPSQHGS